MLSSISPLTAPAPTPPVPGLSLIAQTEAPERVRADSVTIAKDYGFMPAFTVAYAPAAFAHLAAQPDTVSPVSAVLRAARVRDSAGRSIDTYA